MDLINQAESLLQKAKSVFVIDNEPAFVFLFPNMDEANEAFLALNELFGASDITLHIRYNTRFLNFTFIDENEPHKIVNANNVKFDNPYHFNRVKPMSNMVMGADIMGRKFETLPKVLMGRNTTIGGFQSAFLPGFEIGFGKIKKLTTNLIQEP